MHVFVDESQRASYYLVATIVAPADLTEVHKGLGAMLLAGQRRLHFRTESNQRRRTLLAAIATWPVHVWVYAAAAKEPIARRAALKVLLADLGTLATRLVIEHREHSQNIEDRRIIAAAIRRGTVAADLSYTHLPPHQERVLWVSDAVAWAVGAGREWTKRATPLVAQSRMLRP